MCRTRSRADCEQVSAKPQHQRRRSHDQSGSKPGSKPSWAHASVLPTTSCSSALGHGRHLCRTSAPAMLSLFRVTPLSPRPTRLCCVGRPPFLADSAVRPSAHGTGRNQGRVHKPEVKVVVVVHYAGVSYDLPAIAAMVQSNKASCLSKTPPSPWARGIEVDGESKAPRPSFGGFVHLLLPRNQEHFLRRRRVFGDQPGRRCGHGRV